MSSIIGRFLNYGVYIDIDVSDVTPMIEKQIKIDYSTREYANAVPNQIILYVGTSVDNLRKVGELSATKNNSLNVAAASAVAFWQLGRNNCTIKH
jgi:hypothetical protein